jgi:hypothetical protein
MVLDQEADTEVKMMLAIHARCSPYMQDARHTCKMLAIHARCSPYMQDARHTCKTGSSLQELPVPSPKLDPDT